MSFKKIYCVVFKLKLNVLYVKKKTISWVLKNLIMLLFMDREIVKICPHLFVLILKII